jgi:N-acyl-D-amino-acid deacylase
VSCSKIYDVLLKNLKIVDGTCAPAFYGNIGIKGDTIIDVGKTDGQAVTEIDCEGLVAAPGFIDIHNHSDEVVFLEPNARNYTTQGVTTLVVGNCGVSGAPVSEKNKKDLAEVEKYSEININWPTFKDYIRDLETTKKAVNIAALVGHGNIRGFVMGVEDREPTTGEMEKMKALAREAMESGAYGMSSGLIYDPGVFAKKPELIELAKVIARYDGIYATHIRNESDLLVDAVMEAIEVAKNSGVRLELSHHKASGKRNWGLVRTTLDLMQYYRRLGLEITCDVYPCTYCSTDLYSFFPNWTRQGGKKAFLSLIKNEENRNKIKHQLTRPSRDWENILLDCGFDELIIASSKKLKNYEGKNAAAIANELNMNPYDALFYIIENDPDIMVIAGGMCEEDVKYVLKHPLSMVGSDGYITRLGEGTVHPRSYRAFTKVLSKYVNKENELSLEYAVAKMSHYPALKLGIGDRGLLKRGFKADIAVFDMWQVDYVSEFNDPHHYSKGMVHVMVNGEFAIRDEHFTQNLPGMVLKRN